MPGKEPSGILSSSKYNVMNFEQLSEYLENVIQSRLDKELNGKEIPVPEFHIKNSGDNALVNFISNEKLSATEIMVLFIALMPHISPHFYYRIITTYLPNGGDFPEFGGVRGKNHRGILPTGETVLYILGGKDTQKRAGLMRMFDEDHLFAKKNVLFVDEVPAGEPKMSGRLILDDEYLDLFLSGKISKPKLSSDFPAQLIQTQLEWKDLVLKQKTMDEIKEIETWLNYNNDLLEKWKLHGKVKPGYRVLFHGPPGTGKTMTAVLLGKYSGRDVFRIDLSMVVSKYIGETEKNLSKLFDKAAHKDWILFFDEADSIFGKRTNVRDAHDKYANQEVSYLLQRIEAHDGLVILATNMKANIDPSFTRRFNSFIEFENPGPQERQQLWETYLPANVNLAEISGNYELTGANIVNAVQYAGLRTLKNKQTTISRSDLLKGIHKEYQKEGKMIQNS